MLRKDQDVSSAHLSDQQLLRAADGELPTRRASQVHAHLAACWDCRARMAEIEGTIADFARAHRHDLDRQLPPMDGPGALLRAQLAELASQPPSRSWKWLFQFNSPRAAVGATALLIAVIVVGLLFIHSKRPTTSPSAASERGAEPDRFLTPGATRIVSIGEVCSTPHEEVISEVSPSLRQQVFREYGIVNAQPEDYEIDYLIAPGLGGIEDVHNLWPEPSTLHTWNAHVKDTLEEHLHEMVCTGKLDLSTAQRDIATDWIAAYKKYFRTDMPLSLRSNLTRAGPLAGGDHPVESQPF